jgi:hypothetical protein
MIAIQLEGRCEVRGHPWEVAPYVCAVQHFRFPIVRQSDNEIVALCARPQWEDLCEAVRRSGCGACKVVFPIGMRGRA